MHTSPAPSSYQQVIDRYSVPARAGAPVMFQGNLGKVVRAQGTVVRVRFEGSIYSKPFIPSELEWLESPPALSGDSK